MAEKELERSAPFIIGAKFLIFVNNHEHGGSYNENDKTLKKKKSPSH